MNLSTEYLNTRNAGNITAVTDLGGAVAVTVNIYDEFGNVTSSTFNFSLNDVEEQMNTLAAQLESLNSFLADVSVAGVANVPAQMLSVAPGPTTTALPIVTGGANPANPVPAVKSAVVHEP